ncbi:protein TolQ [Immundisolibacter cernigliae]|uniref:Tol-Pal system protein TolQ n=1 Tax=Immundisolibacter cernigliae TaxID=1810504 RepID=A0A1B1YVF3_9GAMM|nr:protein TolQ [Immundisolibacter cernigliae]ANX04719.1 protein TolQ [Immundisolibacter cernigliae]
MANELSIAHLVLGAGPVVKTVMVILLGASVLSWTIMLRKRRAFAQVAAAIEAFERRFWSGQDMEELYKAAAGSVYPPGSVEGLFIGGYREFRHLYEQPHLPIEAALDSAQRGMRAGMSREMEALDEHLPYLATIGSISPYIGLFGTVWGIMSAFQSLGTTGQPTLALVAPAISEALVATAMGLFAAIPAVIAYNRFASVVDHRAGQYDAFIEDFMSLLQRQAHAFRAGLGQRGAAKG